MVHHHHLEFGIGLKGSFFALHDGRIKHLWVVVVLGSASSWSILRQRFLIARKTTTTAPTEPVPVSSNGEEGLMLSHAITRCLLRNSKSKLYHHDNTTIILYQLHLHSYHLKGFPSSYPLTLFSTPYLSIYSLNCLFHLLVSRLQVLCCCNCSLIPTNPSVALNRE